MRDDSRLSRSACTFSGGASYDVMHPEMILITVRTIVIAQPPETDGVPERSVDCDPVHITRIERLNGVRPKRRKSKGD